MGCLDISNFNLNPSASPSHIITHGCSQIHRINIEAAKQIGNFFAFNVQFRLCPGTKGTGQQPGKVVR
jgi:hypothetical protein